MNPLLESTLYAALALLPVVLYLLSLIYMDSYKLVGLRSIGLTIMSGSVAAFASYWINISLMQWLAWEGSSYTRYGSPIVEEVLKATLIVFLLRSHRIGFLVDAAIYGFAAGTGFAVVENIYYLGTASGPNLFVWVVRGFGTAILHGGTTAILSILSTLMAESRTRRNWAIFLPGLAIAIVLHSFYNHFFLTPLLSTVVILLTLPAAIALVFHRSEMALKRWLTAGFDADVEQLETFDSGTFSLTLIGRYLQSLRRRFPPVVVADMLCYLRLHTELGLRAKGVLLMRGSGFKPPDDPEIRDKLQELEHLEGVIGKTGLMSLQPVLHSRTQDLWQIFVLKKT